MIKELNILVVSHNFLLKNFIQDCCRDLFSHKINFEDANLIETAVEIMEQRHFDFVILELNLPESRGVMTITKYRTLLPMTKVIATSWSLDKLYIQECLKAGADAYIAKSQMSATLLMNTCKKILSEPLNNKASSHSSHRLNLVNEYPSFKEKNP